MLRSYHKQERKTSTLDLTVRYDILKVGESFEPSPIRIKMPPFYITWRVVKENKKKEKTKSIFHLVLIIHHFLR